MNEISLKQARELAGLTQLEMDRRASLTKGTTYDLENGRTKRPSHDVVVRVVRVLRRAGLSGVTAEQLFPVPESTEAAS